VQIPAILLFEQTGKYGQDRRDKFLVPTSWLNLMLSEAKVRLMVLSACQSAMVVHDDKENRGRTDWQYRSWFSQRKCAIRVGNELFSDGTSH
jgi:hypothetical protein